MNKGVVRLPDRTGLGTSSARAAVSQTITTEPHSMLKNALECRHRKLGGQQRLQIGPIGVPRSRSAPAEAPSQYTYCS